MTNRRPFVATVAVLVGCAAVPPLVGQGRGVPGPIAFNSTRDGNNEIYVMEWDGRAPLRITNDSASDVDPAISPDGRNIAFTSNRPGNNDIFVTGRGGGAAVNVSNHPANEGWSRWSPDGRHLIFHSNRDGNFEIYVIDADGRNPRRLTDYPGVDQFPEWSPDGRYVAFRRDIDVHVLDLTNGQVRRLTNAPPLNQMAVWSPNGEELVFMSARDGYPSIWRMAADGGGQVNLTPRHPGDADSDWLSRAPSWSTTGQHVFFMSFRPSTGLDTEIFVMNADGTGVRRLTNSIGVDGSPRGR